jgi:MATE family multidrug resistance protein
MNAVTDAVASGTKTDPATAPLITRPGLRQLVALALPIIISRGSQVVVGVTDAIMVGKLGNAALAATTAGAVNAYTLFIFPMGIVFVVASFASQLTGAGDPAGARRFANYGLLVALAWQLVCFLMLPFLFAGVGLFGYDPDVHLAMADYLRWRLLSGGAVVGLEALGAYFGGCGDTRRPMIAQLVAMVGNVGLNWILIDGHLGAPALGVTGSAIASSLASTAAFGLLFVWFLQSNRRPGTRGQTVRRTGEVARLLRIGVPSGITWFIEFAAFSCFINVVLGSISTVAVAGMMSVFQINKIAYLPAFAMACAGSIYVGQAVGARALGDVPRTVRLTLATAVGWQGLVGLCYLLAPALVLSMFARSGSDGEALLQVAVPMLAISAGWQVFDAIGITFTEVLRAVGDTSFVLWARAITAWVVFLPGAWTSVHVFGGSQLVAAGWLGLYYGLFGLTLWLRFRSGRWRQLDITGLRHEQPKIGGDS